MPHLTSPFHELEMAPAAFRCPDKVAKVPEARFIPGSWPGMPTSRGIWKSRFLAAWKGFVHFIWVAILYLVSQLAIWGLSVGLSPFDLSFFASSIGMVLVFICMTLMNCAIPTTSLCYRTWIKTKVDFINVHLSVGFPVPIVMLSPDAALGGNQIARVIGNFVLTNTVSWTLVFGLSIAAFVTLTSGSLMFPWLSCHQSPRCLKKLFPASVQDWLPNTLARPANSHHRRQDREESSLSAAQSSRSSHSHAEGLKHCERWSGHSGQSSWWQYVVFTWPTALSLMCILIIGSPIQAATGSPYILDGCVLWFIWISAVRLQKGFKHSRLWASMPRRKSAIATLMNPVLATTLLMIGYTRIKAAAMGVNLKDVLGPFSSGVPLWVFWTSGVEHGGLTRGSFFGPGDAAMSMLECGLLSWGFKLFECRLQVLSLPGLFCAVLSIAAAAGNVFLSVLCARTIGLATSGALAFAARSTTLALAGPAMRIVGGDLAANAALVVTNGVLGQLLYPFILDKIGVQRHGVPPSQASQQNPARFVRAGGDAKQRRQLARREKQTPERREDVNWPEEEEVADSAVTMAAGTAIGINGAAMGVAYLYETRSRAAPYAALSMTVFGVMTVVFTTVEPFRGCLIELAMSPA